MTKKELQKLEDNILNCNLLHIAIETLEKLRGADLPNDLPERWIREMRSEAVFQVSHHDEDRDIFMENS